MSSLLAALERLLTISEKMAQVAEEQDWETLVRLGGERDAAMSTLPGNLADRLFGPDKARARSILLRCQALDAKTRALIEERQASLRVLLREPAV